MELSQKDLNLVQTYLLRHFSVEELDAAGWLDRPPDKFLRTQLADLDFEFFCRFYLPHHFSQPPAAMHHEFADNINELLCTSTTERANEAIAWPRGFAKTTWGALGLPLWCVVAKRRHFVVILSASHDQSKGQLATVKDEVEHNDRIREDYGDLRGAQWQADDIICNNGGFETNIIALGARMKVRGRKFRQWRPDLIIGDDLEEIAQVQSDTQRTLLENWFMRSVMRAVQFDTIVLVLGTVLHYDGLLRRLLGNPLFRARKYKAVVSWAKRQDLWDAWRQIITDLSYSEEDRKARARQFFAGHEREMLDGAQSAWPEGASYYDLMVELAVIGAPAFSAEMQNEPIDPEQRWFKRWGKYRKEWREGQVWLIPSSGRPAVPLSACAIFGATDPSLGRTARSDPSGIILLAKGPTGQGFVLETDRKRRPPDVIMRDQERWALTYPIARWGIEAVQFQAFFAAESAKASMQANVYLPVVPIQQAHRGGKDLRLQSLQPDLENEYILICEQGQGDLEEELVQFPLGANDHLLDALEIAWRLAQQWKSLESVGIVGGEQFHFGRVTTKAGLATHRALVTDPYAEMDQQADETLRRLRKEGVQRQTEENPPTLEELEEQRESSWFPITLH